MKIILPLKKTELHRQAEVLVRRYKGRDSIFDELDGIYGRESAGYHGEKQLDYYLQLSDLKDSYSLAGLRMKGEEYHFQIDRLLLTPSICFLIESKNLKGKLHLNEQGQLIQDTSEKEIVYDNPYTQVKLQEKQLKQVLKQLGYSNLSIHPLVVFTNRNAILDLGGTPDLITAQQLTLRIDHLLKNREPTFTTSQIKKLASQLLRKHTLRKVNLIERLKISLAAIQTGVFCSHCAVGIMERVYATWVCHTCNRADRRAHIEALVDYATLFGPLITNKTARYFLGVDSHDTVYRLLTKLELPTSGNGKATQYNLEKIIKSD